MMKLCKHPFPKPLSSSLFYLPQLLSLRGSLSKPTKPIPILQLHLICGVVYLPKENKEKPLGEDAHFICHDAQTREGENHLPPGSCRRELDYYFSNFQSSSSRHGLQLQAQLLELVGLGLDFSEPAPPSGSWWQHQSKTSLKLWKTPLTSQLSEMVMAIVVVVLLATTKGVKSRKAREDLDYFEYCAMSCRAHSASLAEFGGVGDGSTSNTKAFQAAINHLSQYQSDGGGLPEQQYRSSSSLWLL